MDENQMEQKFPVYFLSKIWAQAREDVHFLWNCGIFRNLVERKANASWSHKYKRETEMSAGKICVD